MTRHGKTCICSLKHPKRWKGDLKINPFSLRPDLMAGKCCQKILLLGGRFSENILPSGDFLTRHYGRKCSLREISTKFQFLGRHAADGNRQNKKQHHKTWDQGHSPRRDMKLVFAAVARSPTWLLTPHQLSTPVTDTKKMVNSLHLRSP